MNSCCNRINRFGEIQSDQAVAVFGVAVSIELHSVRYVISYIVVYRFAGSMLEPVNRVYLLRAMFEVIMVVDTVYRIRGGRLDAVDVCAFNIDLRKIFKLISGNRISLWKRVKLLDLYVMAHIKIR